MAGIPIALVVLLILWPSIWARVVHDKVSVDIVLHAHQITVGQSVGMTIVIRNLSWLPCPFAEITVELPSGLSVDERGRNRMIQLRTFLLMRQEVQFEVTCFAQKRGQCSFVHRNLTVRLNEGFGFQSVFVTQPVGEILVVLPKFMDDAAQIRRIHEWMGNVEVTRWLHPDETLLRGIREYQVGDPFKHIAWQASARTGAWMTKQFSSSTETTPMILVNAQYADPHWQGTNSDDFEQLCSIAVTCARDMQSRGMRFQFATNAAYPNVPKQRWYGEQSVEGMRVLLGHVQSATNGDFSEILKEARLHGQRRGPVMVFTSFLTDLQWRLLRQMISDGHSLTIVAGPEWDQAIPKIKGLHFHGQSATTRKESISHA
jgi:uncharacterized protein (DUF58 family)